MKDNTILMYHSIGKPGNGEIGAELYCVSVEEFKKQIASSLPACRQAGAPRNDGVAITFDDGLLDNYTNAYPILKEFGIKAYFFVLASKIATKGYMDWKQLKELRDSGMTIGSHGMTHRILTELNDTDLDYELRESKKVLEEKLACSIECLSIPRGFYNQKVIDKAREIGYREIFTSKLKDSDDFIFGRIAVKSNWDLTYFTKVLSRGITIKDRAKELLKDSSKKILGANRYDKLRTAVLRR